MMENTELEIELGDWVVATALGQLRQWRLDGFAIDLSINISAYHLQSKGFVQKLKDSAKRLGAIDCLRRLADRGAGDRGAGRHRPHQGH
jgi:EAL domain-containing protein (putative c-di-GMP-specific phosphodiesterase class I)